MKYTQKNEVISIIISLSLFLFGTFAYAQSAVPAVRDGDGIQDGAVNPSKEVACAADAKICPDGSAVSRVSPTCEFAACPGEKEDGRKLNSGDFTVNPDRIEASRTEDVGEDNDNNEIGDVKEPEDDKEGDSFFDVFTEFNDDNTKEAIDAFIKFDDIKGESNDEATGGDETKDIKDLKNDDSENKIESETKAKKPGEITIVGNRVREEAQVNKVSVRGWDSEKKEVTIAPDDIHNGKDFLDFVGAVTLGDKNIEKIALNPEKITMEYEQPAKLFWFIPINLTARVELDKKDKVKIKFPWYAFLTKNNVKKVKDDVDVLSLSWGAENAGAIGNSTSAWARKFQSLSNALKARHDAAMASIRNIK